MTEHDPPDPAYDDEFYAEYDRLDADELDLPLTGNERHKGFVEYTPRAGSERAWFMDEAQVVISDYARQELRLGTRAIAYRVAAKLGQAHGKLNSIEDAIGMLRRTRRVGIYAVSDNRSEWLQQWTDSANEAALSLHKRIERLHLDRQEGQPWRVVLVVEAAGMLPVVQAVAYDYGVSVVSGSGSVPMSVAHSIAASAANTWQDIGVPTVVLMITDLDLSGLRNIYVPFRRDVLAYAQRYHAKVQVRRIAATPEQVSEHIPENLRLPAPTERCEQCETCLEHRPPGVKRRECRSPRVVTWWPTLPDVEPFSLPAAEALVDQIPDILRAEFDRYLPDADHRDELIEAEPSNRLDAAEALAALLAEEDTDEGDTDDDEGDER